MYNNNRKNGLVLLIVLCGISFGLVKGVNALKQEYKSENIEIAQPEANNGCIVDSTASQNTSSTNGSDNNVVIWEATEYQKVDLSKQEVLAATSNGSCPDTYDSLNLPKRLCSNGSGNLNFAEDYFDVTPAGGGVDVSKIDTFELVEVNEPLAFWLGKYVVKNSNREINEKDPVYSASGEQIDIDYVRKMMAPEQANEVEAEVNNPASYRNPFEFWGKLVVPDNKKINEATDGQYIGRNTPENPASACPQNIQNSDYNPSISNNAGNALFPITQAPNGDNYDLGAGADCIDNASVKSVNNGLHLACNKAASIFDAVFDAVFGDTQWEGCTVGEPKEVCDQETGKCHTEYVKTDNCHDPREFVVKMTPLYGDVNRCTKGVCANSYMTNAYKGGLAPEDSASKVEASTNTDESLMYYIATPCKAVINDNDAQVMDVLCLWDATPLLMNYRLQKKDTAPNQEGFPEDFSKYTSKVDVAIKDSAVKYGIN